MSEYEKQCNRCTEKIKMTDEGGKWQAVNLDGSAHICKPKNGNGKTENGNGNQSEISLDVVLKKLKSIGITIDLDVLKNAVNGAK